MASRVPALPEHTFTTAVGLRWGDLDALGHVNNAVFLRLLEEARVRFLLGLPPQGEHGFGILAARHEIDYLKPLGYSEDPVQVQMWVERVGTSSFTLGYLMADAGGDAVCAAKTVIVAIDAAAGTPVPLPGAIRARAAAFLAEA